MSKKPEEKSKKTAEEKAADRLKTEAARSAAKVTLAGKTPRDFGEEKTKKVLNWIYRWGWASPGTIEKIGGAQRTGLTTRLIKNKLVMKIRSASGGGVKGVPIYLVTLTKLGVEMHERNEKNSIGYEIDPYKINQNMLRHDQLAQTKTLEKLENKIIVEYKTERELAALSLADVKQPDIIWINSNNKRIAVEIELSQKRKRELDEFVRKTCLSLIAKLDKPSRFDFVFIYSDSQAILDNYNEAFEIGKETNKWEKDETRHFKVNGFFTIPESIDGKIKWNLIKI